MTRFWVGIVIFLCGLVIAWVINYLADVLPIKRRLTKPCCIHCQAERTWLDYFTFKKCAICGKAPHIRTWILYLCVPLGFLFIWLFPNTIGNNGAAQDPVIDLILKDILLAYFILVSVIDLEYRAILFPVVIFGALYGVVFGVVYHGWLNTLWGFGTGFGMMLVLYLFGILFVKFLNRKRAEKLDEDALGFGDVNLSGVLGLVLGYPGIIAGLFLGIIIGGIGSLFYLVISRLAGRYKVFTPLPYAPFLITGALVLLFIL